MYVSASRESSATCGRISVAPSEQLTPTSRGRACSTEAQNASIVCPDDHGCDVLCAGDQACQQTEISCGAASCTLTCGEHGQACDALEFRCGRADSYVQCDFDQESDPELVPARDSACACELDRNC